MGTPRGVLAKFSATAAAAASSSFEGVLGREGVGSGSGACADWDATGAALHADERQGVQDTCKAGRKGT